MKNINHESGSVQSYLEILQGVINRMATNSAGCKTWCITLVSVIIVIIADKSKPELIWIGVIPIILFLFLDSYYLGLEQRFRTVYNDFIKKIHEGSATIEDVFIINPGTGFMINLISTFKSIISISIWPFYVLLSLMIIIVQKYVL